MASRAPERPAGPETHVVRFAPFERALHGLLMASFLGLSLTGLPLLFAHAPWAATMAGFLGGYSVTGTLHRTFAILMIATFSTHIARVVWRVYARGELGILWGPDSLVPQPADVRQMLEHFRWFVGRGPRPRFDRFTYWEKFDYWAVFWGMGIIGLSGLMLWFPGFFSRFVPGWLFNVAFVVHGEEALLAMVFIFTVHFFNGHLRPEKYPMDTVIFTGRLPLEELERERPAHAERLRRTGELERLRVTPPPRRLVVGGVIVGTVAITLGLTMVVLTVYALLNRRSVRFVRFVVSSVFSHRRLGTRTPPFSGAGPMVSLLHPPHIGVATAGAAAAHGGTTWQATGEARRRGRASTGAPANGGW